MAIFYIIVAKWLARFDLFKVDRYWYKRICFYSLGVNALI